MTMMLMTRFPRKFKLGTSLTIVFISFCVVLHNVRCEKSATKVPTAQTGAAAAADKEADDGFETIVGDNNQVVAVVETEIGTIITSPEEAQSAGKDPVKMMEKLQENMTADLTESTGKDWGELSATLLNAAWANNGNKTEISVLELMEWFEKVGGEERLHLLRILELMDRNMNGLIGKDEFVALYAGPMASPDKAIELLHRVNDYDGNGYISLWETLTQVLTVDGINQNIYDKYQEASFTNRIQDANLDRFVSLHEYTNYIVWQMNKGIGSQHPVPNWFS